MRLSTAEVRRMESDGGAGKLLAVILFDGRTRNPPQI